MESREDTTENLELSNPRSLCIKVAYTAFVAVLVPVYWQYYGVTNFLWFSDIALLLTLVAIWRENGLLASMMALAVLVFDSFWSIEFLLNLAIGTNLTGLTTFMFDSSLPLFLRGLSLFHLFLPPVLVWLVYRLGYDSRALLYQTILAWIVLPATYLLTEPSQNINMVFALSGSAGKSFTSPLTYLALLLIGVPLLIYLPTHLALRVLFGAED